MRALLLAIAFLTGAASAAAQADAGFAEAAKLVQRASAGDRSAIEPAADAFEALGRAEPDNPLYAAYLGSATGMKAGQAWMPWTKMKYGEQALDHVDRALRLLKPADETRLVRGSPMGLETRIVAATVFLRMPDGIFHRRAAGRKLIAQVFADPRFASSPAPLRAAAERAAALQKEPGQ
jgi:hypothetical protein